MHSAKGGQTYYQSSWSVAPPILNKPTHLSHCKTLSDQWPTRTKYSLVTRYRLCCSLSGHVGQGLEHENTPFPLQTLWYVADWTYPPKSVQSLQPSRIVLFQNTKLHQLGECDRVTIARHQVILDFAISVNKRESVRNLHHDIRYLMHLEARLNRLPVVVYRGEYAWLYWH